MASFQKLIDKLEQLKSDPEKYDLSEKDIMLIDETIEEINNLNEGLTDEQKADIAIIIIKMIYEILAGG